jgi:hypothetical protein
MDVVREREGSLNVSEIEGGVKKGLNAPWHVPQDASKWSCIEGIRLKGECKKCQKVHSLIWCRSVDTLFHSSLLYFPTISVPLFNLFVTRPRCSLMNEKVLHVIVLHSLYSTMSASSIKQLTCYVLLCTSHVLAVSPSSFNLQTIKLTTAHIMVDLTYCCSALQKSQYIAVRVKRYLHVIIHTCETIV